MLTNDTHAYIERASDAYRHLNRSGPQPWDAAQKLGISERRAINAIHLLAAAPREEREGMLTVMREHYQEEWPWQWWARIPGLGPDRPVERPRPTHIDTVEAEYHRLTAFLCGENGVQFHAGACADALEEGRLPAQAVGYCARAWR